MGVMDSTRRGHLWPIVATVATLMIALNGGHVGSTPLMEANFDARRMPVDAVSFVLIGVYDNQVWPTMGSVPAYKCLAIVVLGGLGNIPGSVLASFLIGLAETLLIGVVAIPFPRDALAFVAMILVLMFRPHGLLGKG